jgi:multicomponent Na+:H+ antiporter subunit D
MPVAREHLAPVLLAIAIATALLGPLSAIAETNLRRAIGFMLIGGVGVILLCLPTVEISTYVGCFSYGFHSILTLTALYMIAGLIERATGQTDSRQMRGLYAANSLLSLLFLVLILAISGVPPFLGFWPKLLILQGTVGSGDWVSTFALLLNALLTLIAGTRLWSHIFWRGTAEKAKLPFAPVAATWVLTAVIVVLGLAPSPLIDAAQVAAKDLLDPIRYIAAVGLNP